LCAFYVVGEICLKRKSLALLLVLSILMIGYVPLIDAYTSTQSLCYKIHVDDDNIEGPWDGTQEHPYQHIQDAINNALNTDTIFVYNGLYHENIKINKSIMLIGEEKNSTVIHGLGHGDTVTIVSENVLITEFTIRNCGPSGRDAGIESRANSTTIKNNIIKNNTVGVYLFYSDLNVLSNNTFISNKDYGTFLYFSKNNTISHNIFHLNRWGIYLIYSNQNVIFQNYVDSSYHHGIWISSLSHDNIIIENKINNSYGFGLFCYNSQKIKIYRNDVSNNSRGIYLTWANKNNITHNNFHNNVVDAAFRGSENIWHGNFWNQSRVFPKIIIEDVSSGIPDVDFDWYPAQQPHNIPTKKMVIKHSAPKYVPNYDQNSLPPSFSWKDVNGTDYTTPIKNQAPAPTCETYALCASLETIMQYQMGEIYTPDLSETHLFFNSGGTCRSGGVLLGDAAEYLVQHGVPDEGCFPDPHRPHDYPFENLDRWENRSVKIQEWGWVENDVEAMKLALIEHGPLVIHIIVRKDFNLYKGGIYEPKPTNIIGGHLITIIGYDDEQGCWTVKNSAGEKWGENGYGRISYDAHSSKTPFFWPFYGGTGITYITDVYGNFMPDVPKIQIDQPKIYHTYIFGFEFPSLFRKISGIQDAAPRIAGKHTVKINATNTNKVEFYLDGELQFIDEELPYEWDLDTTSGLHTIKTLAYNERNMSKDIVDVFVLI
jgi:parallel beta-helix repeat protein